MHEITEKTVFRVQIFVQNQVLYVDQVLVNQFEGV